MLSIDDCENLAKALCAFLRVPGFPPVFKIDVYVQNVPADIISQHEDNFFQHNGQGEILEATLLVRLQAEGQCQWCFRLRGRGQGSQRNRMISILTGWQNAD